MLIHSATALVALTALATAQEPTPRIHFVRDDAIWSCAPDGGDPREELARVAHGYGPFAVLGGRLAAVVPHTGTSRVVIRAQEGDPTILPVDGFVTDVQWRPKADGAPPSELTLVVETENSRHDLVRIDLAADDPSPLALLADDTAAKLCAWSPDGRFLAFARTLEREAERYADMITITWRSRYELLDPETGKITPLAEDLEGHPSAVTFSPDGRHVVLGFRESGLHLVDLAGDAVGPHRTLTERSDGERGLRWSADGNRLLTFDRGPRKDGKSSNEDLLFLVSRDGEVTAIPLGRTIYDAVWEPAEAGVVFADREKRLVLRGLGDGRETVLLEGVGFFTRLVAAGALAAPTRRDR